MSWLSFTVSEKSHHTRYHDLDVEGYLWWKVIIGFIVEIAENDEAKGFLGKRRGFFFFLRVHSHGMN